MKYSGDYTVHGCIMSKLLSLQQTVKNVQNLQIIKISKKLVAVQNLAFHEARDIIQRETYANKVRPRFISFDKDKNFPSVKAITNFSNAVTL